MNTEDNIMPIKEGTLIPDYSDPNNPKILFYWEGKWHELKSAEEK